MIEEEEIEIKPVEEEHKNKLRPTLQTWKGEKIVRVHSIKATVKEILQVSNVLDVVKVGIIGEPATGKTTLAGTIAHLIHKQSPIPWVFRIFGEDEFLKMEETIKELEPANYILYFHDLSFLAEKKKIEEVKRVITKIRHLREDVKIILIYDYHYTLGLDKYLRQANFRYFTSLGSSEEDNMLKIVGTRYQSRIKEFQELFVEMTTRYRATIRLAGNKYFRYNYKNPFVVCLFYNNSRLRYVIFPQREWIDPICSDCSKASGQLIESAIPVEQFVQESKEKFGTGVFTAAVKLNLYGQGINAYSNMVVQALRYLAQAREKKLISLEEVALHCGLKVTNARLKKKLDGVMA
jgi:energy-coupling factor transporter ATP-binding protein EcfA2